MPYTSRYQGTTRVPLTDPLWWVEVRNCLTGGQKSAIREKQITYGVEEVPNRLTGGVTTRAKIQKIDASLFLREQAIASIVDWNLTGDDDQVLALSPIEALRASYQLLSEEDMDLLEAKCNELNAEPTKEEEARFPNGSDGSVSAEGDDASDDSQILQGTEILATSGNPS
jgi:hypothetical protein